MGFRDFNVHFWGESPLQFLSLHCQLHVHKKKNIKNTTFIKTVIFASCGTFIGNFVPSSSFIMHFLLTCITIIKTTVLITCVLLILMFMLMLQHWSVASLNSRFLPEWRIKNKLLRIALWIEPHKTRQNSKDSPMTDFSIILHAHWHNTKWHKMAWFIPASTAVCLYINFVRS